MLDDAKDVEIGLWRFVANVSWVEAILESDHLRVAAGRLARARVNVFGELGWVILEMDHAVKMPRVRYPRSFDAIQLPHQVADAEAAG